MPRTPCTRSDSAANPQDYVNVGGNETIDFGNYFAHALDNFSWIYKWRRGNTMGNVGITVMQRGAYNATTPGYRFALDRQSVSASKYGRLELHLVVRTAETPTYAEYIAYGNTGQLAILGNRKVWHTIAFTVDRAGYMTIYIDGLPDTNGANNPKSIAAYAAYPADIGSSLSCTIGVGGAGQVFSEDVCQVGHYNRALTAAEIAAIHAGTVDPATLSGCTGFWPFDDGKDTSQNPGLAYCYATVGPINSYFHGSFVHERRIRSLVDDSRLLRIGLYSDLHHGESDGPTAHSTTAYLDAAVAQWNKEGVDLIVGCGDQLLGSGTGAGSTVATMQGFMAEILTSLTAASARYGSRMICGNHDDTAQLVMTDFVDYMSVTHTPLQMFGPHIGDHYRGYWSEDVGGVHCVFLYGHDAEVGHAGTYLDGGCNDNQDEIAVLSTANFGITDKPRYASIENEIIRYTGTTESTLTGCQRGVYGGTAAAAAHDSGKEVLPETSFFMASDAQLDWLEGDLAATSLPTIVFDHYRLDRDWPGYTSAGTLWFISGGLSVFGFNADKLRAIFERHNVKLVVSGHEHGNHWRQLNGINYLNIPTLERSAAETPARYMTLDFFSNGEFKAVSYVASGDPYYVAAVPPYTRR